MSQALLTHSAHFNLNNNNTTDSLAWNISWNKRIYLVIDRIRRRDPNISSTNDAVKKYVRIRFGSHSYQSQVSILGPVGYGPTTLPLRHSDCC